jgi:uncharacterized protein (DUF1810 family)
MQEDRHRLERFVAAQEGSYDAAREELGNGRKRSHWMWFIFPQLVGLGSSWNSVYFGIAGKKEAMAYLEHPDLGVRLRECTTLVMQTEAVDLLKLLGSEIDVLKFHACMTLFSAVSPDERIFSEAIQKYFDGVPHAGTLALLRSS